MGEGSSFRRQERERYAAPGLRNMANLAHATEEELLAAAEVQVGGMLLRWLVHGLMWAVAAWECTHVRRSFWLRLKCRCADSEARFGACFDYCVSTRVQTMRSITQPSEGQKCSCRQA